MVEHHHPWGSYHEGVWWGRRSGLRLRTTTVIRADEGTEIGNTHAMVALTAGRFGGAALLGPARHVMDATSSALFRLRRPPFVMGIELLYAPTG
jgi:hypothetical protein